MRIQYDEEEGGLSEAYPEVTELPYASTEERDDLQAAPPDRFAVGVFAEVTELGLALALELLLFADVSEFGVEFADTGSEVLYVAPVTARVIWLCVADDDVEMHAHLRGRVGSSIKVGGKANPMVSRLVRRECKLALRWSPSRRYNVVVSYLFDADQDTQVVLHYEALKLCVPFLSHVVAHDYRVVRKLLEETFRRPVVHVKVELRLNHTVMVSKQRRAGGAAGHLVECLPIARRRLAPAGIPREPEVVQAWWMMS